MSLEVEPEGDVAVLLVEASFDIAQESSLAQLSPAVDEARTHRFDDGAAFAFAPVEHLDGDESGNRRVRLVEGEGQRTFKHGAQARLRFTAEIEEQRVVYHDEGAATLARATRKVTPPLLAQASEVEDKNRTAMLSVADVVKQILFGRHIPDAEHA